LNFNIHQDQSELLKLSIDNLKSSLILGSVLAILVMFLFLKDIRSPIVIGVSIPLSLIICFLLMYVLHISINIISLSGLILGVGMMIDNAIIIIDNITQKLENGEQLIKACAGGTSEMISPLISSVLTTSLIFIPLIFLSGITGALFYDQAMAVSIGLFSSLLVSIFFIPVLYFMLMKTNTSNTPTKERIDLSGVYKKGFQIFYYKPKVIILIGVILLGLGCLMLRILPLNALPDLKENEAIINLDWNENISIDENNQRISQVFDSISYIDLAIETGEQKYLLQREADKTLSEAKVYIKFKSVEDLEDFKTNFKAEIETQYSKVKYNFSPPENIFQYIFGQVEDFFVAQIFSNQSFEAPNIQELSKLKQHIPFDFKPLPTEDMLSIRINHDKMLLYNVGYSKLTQELKTLLNQNYIDNLKNTEQIIPIRFGVEVDAFQTYLSTAFVTNQGGNFISLKELISIQNQNNYKIITADRAGEYLSIVPKTQPKNLERIIAQSNTSFAQQPDYSLRFSGAYFDNQNLFKELIGVFLIALLLLYFVMAAQFNSLLQPLIILTEIPINVGGSLFLVWLFGGSLNIMTGIGIVVMAGIVINDSIIKIHTINSLRESGLEIDTAIEQAGVMRLKPILMTSLTTILALTPFLFISGLGADLQKPLALSVIGGLIVGTFVSLYFIPIFYKLIVKSNT